MLGLLLFFLVYACYRGSGNLENRLVSASNKEAPIFDRSDYANNAAGRDHAIAYLQLRDRLLQLALSLLLRSYQQHIKDAYDEQHWQQPAECTQTALKKNQKSIH